MTRNSIPAVGAIIALEALAHTSVIIANALVRTVDMAKVVKAADISAASLRYSRAVEFVD